MTREDNAIQSIEEGPKYVAYIEGTDKIVYWNKAPAKPAWTTHPPRYEGCADTEENAAFGVDLELKKVVQIAEVTRQTYIIPKGVW